MNHHSFIHSFITKSSVTPLQTPHKLPHSYITDKETGFLHRLSEGTHSNPVLLYSSNLIPPRLFRGIYRLTSTSSFTPGVITPDGQLNNLHLFTATPSIGQVYTEERRPHVLPSTPSRAQAGS